MESYYGYCDLKIAITSYMMQQDVNELLCLPDFLYCTKDSLAILNLLEHSKEYSLSESASSSMPTDPGACNGKALKARSDV